MKRLILSFFAVAALSAAADRQTFIGAITDDICPKADHSGMAMGPTDADCAVACINSHGAAYVLYDGKDTYTLSDQRSAEQFAAKRVKVTGALDPKTKMIQVESIVEATAAK